MFKKKLTIAISTIAIITASVVHAQSTRDSINIVGSYTGSPLATAVAERFTKATNAKAPQIQINGTGGGLKSFCAGAGVETPDATTATRRIRRSEVELCEKNGVREIIEIKFGYDALVAAQSPMGKLAELSHKELFLAMAKDVPDPKDGVKLIPNPYKTWRDINPSLPDLKILIWGPDPTIGSYDALLNQIMLAGCKQFDSIKALESSDSKTFETTCKTFRKDGAYNEFGDYNAVIRDLRNNPDALGIIGFSISQRAGLKNPSIDGTEPTLVSISQQQYTLTLPLYLYVKKAHINTIPGLKEYLAEFTSEKALSTTGYFFDMGIVPMPLTERQQARANAEGLKSLIIGAGDALVGLLQ